jgi:DNA-binding response OmpR family regulator
MQTSIRPPAASVRAPVLLAVTASDARELYSDFLAFRGHRVEAISSAHEVVDGVARLRPRVVLLNLDTVDDSLRAARRIRDAAEDECRVVILGDDVTTAQTTLADEAGAMALIAKPIAAQDVVELIEALAHS